MSDIIARAIELRKAIEQSVQTGLSDKDALSNLELFPAWNGNGIQLEADFRLKYNGKLYRVVVAHKTQQDWTPDTMSTLFKEIKGD